MNSNAQEFIGFKLLIGAIIALFILFIILSVISYVEEFKYSISEKNLYEGIKSAINAPEQVVQIKELTFREGSSYSSSGFAKKTPLKRECFNIDASQTGGFNLQSPEVIQVKQTVKTDVYVKCVLASGDCFATCTVSFGKPIPTA